MSDLSPDARELLELARHVDDPSPSDKARVKAAVLAAATTGSVVAISSSAMAAGAAQAGGASAAGVGAASAAGVATVTATAVKAAAVLTVVGATVGVAVVKPWEPPPEPAPIAVVEQETVEQRMRPPIEEPRQAIEEPRQAIVLDLDGEEEEERVAAPDEVAPELPAPAPRVRRAPQPPAPASQEPAEVPSPSTLSDELELLRRAQRALASQDPSQALAALREHRERFPNGQLSAERQGTEALALCRSRSAAAQGAAERFLQSHPRSPLASRVREACGFSD